MEDNNSKLHPFVEVAKGKRIVYVATRLYDYNEKLATLRLETAILAGLSDASEHLGIPLEVFPTFMPFRDTVENVEEIGRSVQREHKARAIYEDDSRRLDRLFALVTYLNDPCKDDGICMEIGFAFAKQVPILIVLTDFIHYSSISAPEIEFAIDPIIIRMCGQIIHRKTLSSSKVPFPKDRNYDSMREVVNDFEERLNEANQQLYVEVREHVKKLALDSKNYTAPLPIMQQLRDNSREEPIIFIDFSGCMYEWNREYVQRLVNLLTSKGMTVRVGKRHDPSRQASLHKSIGSQPMAYELGDADITAALTSDLLVLSADGIETDSGTAALQGAARALNKRIVLYYSGNLQTNARDRAPTARNLMLLYSADRIATQLDDIPQMIQDLL